MHQRTFVAILILCIASFGLSGCVTSKYGAQTAIVKQYPDCYAPIQKLRDDESRVSSSVVTTALTTGFITGLVTALFTRDVKSTVIATTAATLAGGAFGYFNAVSEKNKDENARMAQYMQDLNGDISNLNIATASARMAIQCYEQKFQIALSQYKKKQISREQLTASYTEIKSGLNEAQGILGNIIVSAQKNDEQYRGAIEGERITAASRPQAVPQPKTTQASQQRQAHPQPAPGSGSLSEVQAKQANYQASIQDAQTVKQEADAFRKRMEAHMS